MPRAVRLRSASAFSANELWTLPLLHDQLLHGDACESCTSIKRGHKGTVPLLVLAVVKARPAPSASRASRHPDRWRGIPITARLTRRFLGGVLGDDYHLAVIFIGNDYQPRICSSSSSRPGLSLTARSARDDDAQKRNVNESKLGTFRSFFSLAPSPVTQRYSALSAFFATLCNIFAFVVNFLRVSHQ